MAEEPLFKLDPVALAQLIRGPEGPVVKDLLRRADELIVLAKRQVPYGSSPALGSLTGSGGRSQPHLRDTIVKRVDFSSANGPIVYVGSDAAPKALFVHEGTRAHEIRPRTASVLRFSSRGKVVFAKKVNHPGTRANHYLTDNLPKVMR